VIIRNVQSVNRGETRMGRKIRQIAWLVWLWVKNPVNFVFEIMNVNLLRLATHM